MTAFNVGDRLVARMKAQGLELGSIYIVAEVHEQPTMFGTFVTYFVKPEGEERLLTIGNGHMLLGIAPPPWSAPADAGSRELIANSDAYVSGEISYEVFDVRARALWTAVEARGPRAKAQVVARIRRWQAAQMAALPPSHGGTGVAL